jgi:osmotically-inducible protein OsmY
MSARVRLLLVGTLLCVVGAGYVVEHAHNPTREPYSNRPANEQQQKEDASDREITRTIRREIGRDTKLSTYAHNVKIHVEAGQVTLRGLVRSEFEAMDIRAKAVAVAGEGNVNNQLEVVDLQRR